MSEKLSKSSRANIKKGAWRTIALTTLWAGLSLLLASQATAGLIKLALKLKLVTALNPSVLNTLAGILIFVLSLLGLLFGQILAKKYPRRLGFMKFDKLILGWGGWLSWQHLFLGIATFLVFMFASSLLISLIKILVPNFPIEQGQDVGISAAQLYYRRDFLLVFALLVLVGPLVEELIFRGYLYGKIRQKTTAWLATLIVSILFGLAHGQWNVGLITFVMSIGMCLCREVTGSLYPAIIIHMIKNGLAFVLLFILKV